jgi:phage terminase small subunit
VTGTPERLKPPRGLSDIQRKFFIEIVTAVPSEHFRPSDAPLLAAYCRACADEIEAAERKSQEGAVIDGKRSAWDAVQRDAAKSMGVLAGLLRLTPRARKPWSQPHGDHAGEHVRPYERIRMELDDRDHRCDD